VLSLAGLPPPPPASSPSCSSSSPLDIVDLVNLDDRLAQNRLQEHLTNLWLDHL
jgi:hypothetical protein